MIDLRDRLETLAERGTPTEPSIFVERIRRGLQQPEVTGGRRWQGNPFRTALVAGVVVVLVALTAVWLVGRDGRDQTASSAAEWQVLFCRSVTNAVPEDFVGSDEHIAQLDQLISGAPSAIASDLRVVRDYIDEHVNPARPESSDISRWPQDVQAANRGIMDYAERHCPLQTTPRRDWVVPYVPDPAVNPEDEAPEPDVGAVPLPRGASPQTQARADAFQALLPPGWTMQNAGETVFPNGDVTQTTWFKHEDGISVLYATWVQLSEPIAILPPEGSPEAESVGHEREAEGEFVVQSLQPGEIQLGLVRPDGRSINLAYTIVYTPEQNRGKVDAEGGPRGRLDEAALRALAIEATK